MFQIDFTSRIPIYEQLCSNVIRLASAGVLKPGDRIPAVRALATELGVNPNTVAKAYKELEARGYIYSAAGRGSFVTEELSSDSANKLLAIESFKKACGDARTFGATKQQLNEIIETVFEGGADIDRN
ncbi:MAG: GntR family transcriptional regulator [Clostridia bacterium]|nr:GntR family transcriptional regulator [Clostridia bacterium]